MRSVSNSIGAAIYGGHEENVMKDVDTSSPSSAARMTIVTGLATRAIGVVVAAATG